MVGSREEAQEIGQETFLRMCLHARGYRPSGQVRSWLYRIAGNLARSHLRRRKLLGWVRFEPAVHDRGSTAAAPDADTERRELRERVRAALSAIPDRQRQAIVLQHSEGLSCREIAAAMGTSVLAVETPILRWSSIAISNG
jgi:RNA polymerase sigma factor (sigma-70 family)